MGFALPGAIAASLVHPDRKVLAIAGDAGFLMNSQEMETATRLNSNIVVMVWEDHAYGLIAWKQETEFGRHTDLEFGNPDWLQLASAFGWHGPPKPIIHADFLAAEIDVHYHPEVELIGDLAHTLWMLNERLGQTAMPQFDLDRQNESRQRMAADFAEFRDDNSIDTIRPR